MTCALCAALRLPSRAVGRYFSPAPHWQLKLAAYPPAARRRSWPAALQLAGLSLWFFRGLLAVLAQGPWLTQLYALLCEAERDGTHGRSPCGCYPPLRFRSLTFIAPSHVAIWWNQRKGVGFFDTARSPAIDIPARLAPNKVD